MDIVQQPFYVISKGNHFACYRFNIEQYGINQPFKMMVKVLVAEDDVCNVLQLADECCLMVRQQDQMMPFHGIIRHAAIVDDVAVNDYFLVRCHVENHQWHSMQAVGSRTFHHQPLSDCINGIADSLSWPSTSYQLKSLDTAVPALRHRNQQTYASFLLDQLHINNSYVQTLVEEKEGKLVFSNDWAELTDKAPRKLIEVEPSQMNADEALYDGHRYFDLIRTVSEKHPPTLQIKCHHIPARPGDKLSLAATAHLEAATYPIISMTISGEQPLRFDSGAIETLRQAELLSHIYLKTSQSYFERDCNRYSEAFTVYSGRIEAHNPAQSYPDRTAAYHYNARFDFEEQCEGRASPTAAYQAAPMAKALNNVCFNSLMAGEYHGTDLPIYHGTEVLLVNKDNQSEPALALGMVHNQSSGVLPSASNSNYQNILKTATGNELCLVDAQYNRHIQLGTYQMQNVLAMYEKNGLIELRSEQGELSIKSQQPMLIKAGTLLHFQAETDLSDIISQTQRLISYHSNIETMVTGSIEHTIKQQLSIKTKSATFSAGKVIHTATDILHVLAPTVNLESDEGSVIIEADTMVLNFNQLIARSGNSELTLDSDHFNLRSSQVIFDVEQAAFEGQSQVIAGKHSAPPNHQASVTPPQMANHNPIEPIDLTVRKNDDVYQEKVKADKESSILKDSASDAHFIKLDELDEQDELAKQTYLRTMPVKKLRQFPPVIVNLRENINDEHRRDLLTEKELQYFKQNGNNVMIFIHGYNVEYGAFSKKASSMKDNLTESLEAMEMGWPVPAMHGVKVKVELNYQDELSDKWINKSLLTGSSFRNLDRNNLAKIDFSALNTINGSGMHEWLTNFEHNVNQAADISPDSPDYQRCLFIAWPGNPENPADYLEAATTSRDYGVKVAKLLKQIRDFDSEMQINIVAHSQGNGVLIKALNYLGEYHKEIKVDNCFLWQAAIPDYSFSTSKQHQYCPWHSPHAYKATKHITVFHSQNDNILGPMLLPEEQPLGVDYQTVYNRKPEAEMLFGFICRFSGLQSLYQAAMRLEVPFSMMLDEHKIDAAWALFKAKLRHKQIDAAGLKETLREQITSVNKRALFRFTTHLGEQLREAKPKIKEMSGYLAERQINIRQDLHVSLKFIYELLSHIDHIVKALVDEDHYFSKPTFLLRRMAPPLIAFESVKRAANFAIYHYMPHFDKFITFLYSALVQVKHEVNPAMGYNGVDKETAKQFAYMLDNIPTTKWVYHHSDMKYSSNDIDKEIYHDRIIDKKDLRFQFHIGKGEHDDKS